MALLRIRTAEPLQPFKLRLILSDGSSIERDISRLLVGPVFEKIRNDPRLFAQVRVEGGTVVWPNGADLCPDVLIWGGAPPQEGDATTRPEAVAGLPGER
jgi:uncharacterized protein DUF2442